MRATATGSPPISTALHWLAIAAILLSEMAIAKAALARFHTEDFGLCQACGEEIAERRLLNDRTVIHCIRCAS